MTPSLHVLVVSGLSGSGRSSAIRVLEDLGYYCLDNLPVTLIPNFLDLCAGLPGGVRHVALGIDIRERTSFRQLPEMLDGLRSAGHHVEILFLDASDEVLVRRFSETRRPHPLAQGGTPADGVRRERTELEGIRARADRILDTSAWSVHDLRDELRRCYESQSSAAGSARTTFVSFGFKYGAPSDVDMVFDVRFLPNPFFEPELRGLTGHDSAIRKFLLDREETREFLERSVDLLRFLLPHYRREGKSYFTVGVGCTGGRHRSVAIVEEMAQKLEAAGESGIGVRHRDVEREA